MYSDGDKVLVSKTMGFSQTRRIQEQEQRVYSSYCREEGLIRLDPSGVENTVPMYRPRKKRCYHLRALAHASSLLDHDWPSTVCSLTLESAGACQIDFLLGGTSRGQPEIPLWR